MTLQNYLPPSLAADLAVRYQPRVVRSPAAHAKGVRRWPGCPHTSSPSASAGGKGTPRASLRQSPQATSGLSHVPHPSPLQLHRRPLQGRDSPARNPNRTCSTRNRKRAPDNLTCGRIRLATPGSKPNCQPATKPHQKPVPATRERLRRPFVADGTASSNLGSELSGGSLVLAIPLGAILPGVHGNAHLCHVLRLLGRHVLDDGVVEHDAHRALVRDALPKAA